LALPLGAVAGVVTGFFSYRLFLLVLPFLRLLVAKGIVCEPDKERLNAKIGSYIGGSSVRENARKSNRP
jgi:hypothetical protein